MLEVLLFSRNINVPSAYSRQSTKAPVGDRQNTFARKLPKIIRLPHGNKTGAESCTRRLTWACLLSHLLSHLRIRQLERVPRSWTLRLGLFLSARISRPCASLAKASQSSQWRRPSLEATEMDPRTAKPAKALERIKSLFGFDRPAVLRRLTGRRGQVLPFRCMAVLVTDHLPR